MLITLSCATMPEKLTTTKSVNLHPQNRNTTPTFFNLATLEKACYLYSLLRHSTSTWKYFFYPMKQ